MLDKELFAVNSGPYEDGRGLIKLSTWQLFLILFKSTSSISVFGFHQVFLRSGVVLGLLISIVTVFSMNYACLRFVAIAEMMNEGEKKFKTKNFFELVEMSFSKEESESDDWLIKVVRNVSLPKKCFYLGLCVMSAEIITNLMNLMNLMAVGGFPIYFVIPGLGLVLVLIMVTLKPERLVYLAFVATIVTVLMTAACSFWGLKVLLGHDGVSPFTKMWDFKDIGLSCGYAISCIEVVNSVMNCKRMAAKKAEALFMTTCTFALYSAGLMSVLPALVVYLALEGKGLQDQEFYFNSFDSHQTVKILYFFLSINLILGAAKNTIFCVEMIERVSEENQNPWVENNQNLNSWVRKKQIVVVAGLQSPKEEPALDEWKIIRVRLFCLAILFIPAFFARNYRKVYSVIGFGTACINSFIALIVPALISFMRQENFRRDDSLGQKVLDYFALSVGCLAIIFLLLQAALFIFGLLF
jgi:hypothetical protein